MSKEMRAYGLFAKRPCTLRVDSALFLPTVPSVHYSPFLILLSLLNDQNGFSYFFPKCSKGMSLINVLSLIFSLALSRSLYRILRHLYLFCLALQNPVRDNRFMAFTFDSHDCINSKLRYIIVCARYN